MHALVGKTIPLWYTVKFDVSGIVIDNVRCQQHTTDGVAAEPLLQLGDHIKRFQPPLAGEEICNVCLYHGLDFVLGMVRA